MIAFIIGLFSAWTLSQVEDKKMLSISSYSFIQKIKKCFQNTMFIKLLFSLSLINFSVVFMMPFVTLFMLKFLEIPMSTILIFTLIMQLSYTFVIKTWGKIADKKDTLKILETSIPLLLLSLFVFLGINQLTLSIYSLYSILGIGHIVLGIATAGITLGINNASLIYIPKESSNIYLSVNSVLKSFAGGIAFILAGITLSLCTFLENQQYLKLYCNKWTLFWGVSIIICILVYYVTLILKNSLSSCKKEKYF